MIPGEIFTLAGDIEINKGRRTVTLEVANTGDRPIQVGSHYHFSNKPLAQVRPQKGARHASRHCRRHRGSLRTGAEPRGSAGRARRQAGRLRLSPASYGQTVTPRKTGSGRGHSPAHRSPSGAFANARSAGRPPRAFASAARRGSFPCSSVENGKPLVGSHRIPDQRGMRSL